MDDERIDVVYSTPKLWAVMSAHSKRPAQELKDEYSHRTFVALDPGETTGVAVWKEDEIRLFQIETKEIGYAYRDIRTKLSHYQLDHIRCEEYRVYNWMADQHSWSILHTPQLIGAVKVMAMHLDVPISFKLAQMAKAVWNDNVLKATGIYSPGLKHARDACRHLLYYMTFPDKVD